MYVSSNKNIEVIPKHYIELFMELNIYHIKKLRNQITSIRDSKNRTTSEAIFILSVKLPTGIPNKLSFAIFNLKREQMVSGCTANFITAFEKDIFKFGFGIHNKS